MKEPKLTSQRVHNLMAKCLYTEDELEALNLDRKELPEGAVVVDGITAKFGFSPDNLEKHKDEIKELISELPEKFDANGEGGGASFLEAYLDKNGNHWGEHRNMEALFVLGIAVGMAKFLMPRDMWPALPGAMPYIATFPDREPEVIKE